MNCFLLLVRVFSPRAELQLPGTHQEHTKKQAGESLRTPLPFKGMVTYSDLFVKEIPMS